MEARWSARAFGLTVRGGFDAPGLDGDQVPAGNRDVAVALVPPAAVEERPDADVVCERVTPDGRLVMRIEYTSSGEYRIDAPGYGTFLVSADGRRIDVAPAHPRAWRWQRYLFGQALPLAAVLQGVEVLHASAVLVDGRAVAFAGASLAGKTTLAVAMLEAGATLLCDDVLAIEAVGDRLVAHPGPAVVNLRHASAAAVRPSSARSHELGRDEEAVRLQVEARAEAAPLAAVYLLQRDSSCGAPMWEAPVGEATLLLASSFNFIVLTQERLRRQLDVCSRIASTTDVARLRMPVEWSAPALARSVIDRLREGVRCAA